MQAEDFLQPQPTFPSPTCSGVIKMADPKAGNYWRAFRDFFILFSGISTASNLARTQGRKLLTRGLFLFRPSPDNESR